MNLSFLRTSAALLFVAFSACAPQKDKTRVEESVLTIAVRASTLYCVEGSPQMWMSGELTSTAEPRPVDMVVMIDGQVTDVVEVIPAENFVQEGEMISAVFEFGLDVPEGEHVLDLCFAARPEEGESADQTCLPPRDYLRECGDDEVEPTIVARRRQAENEYGWYNQPVTVSFTCTDEGSGIASCSDTVVFTDEGLAHEAEGVAVDNEGNTAEIVEGPIRIDFTPPEIRFVGARDYMVDELLSVSCSVRDDLSGVLESSCSGNSGEAYMFDLGSYEVEANAVDLAGNAASQSSAFTVSADAASVCVLVRRFVTDRSVQNSLCQRLSDAESAFVSGNDQGGSDLLDSFHAEIDQETDLSVPAEHAGTLVRLSVGLRPGA